MLGKENIEKQVADNQMDYVDTKSTIEAIGSLNHEDRLSSEELQHERSQENSGVTRSSSASSNSAWHSALTDDESMIEVAYGMSLTDDEIVKKATLFVKTFVKECEKKIFEYSEEIKPGSKIRKTGKIVGNVASTVSNYIPPSGERVGISKVIEGIIYVFAKEHRGKAKKVSAAIVPIEDEVRKILVEAGLEIFQKFEQQFIKVVDVDTSYWSRGVQKLAIDAVSRVINYISANSKEEGFSVDLITKGLILGESKSNTLPQCVFRKSVELLIKNIASGESKNDTRTKRCLRKPAKFLKLRKLQSGYTIKDKQNNDEFLVTSELYKGVGIERKDGNATSRYQSKEYNYAEKYGYRRPFAWELEIWEEIEQKYVLSETPKERYVYILDEKRKKKLVDNILKEINGKDLTKKKDIEELHEEIKNLQICCEKEGKNTFSFHLGYLPKFFVKREMMLDELKKKLSSKNQEVEMSRMVLINGEYGTGKSELARSYGYNKGEDSNVWTKVVWINAETCDTLLNSFRNLAKELKISTENDIDHNVVRGREIESITKSIYQYFRDVKSLFIFDNANGYKEIEKFLPSNFSDLFFGGEKPYVLITSRSKNWEEGIEKIELNNGFSLGEAITFIERILGIEKKDRLQNRDFVELAEALSYLPLALAQATAYIKQEKINISEYLKCYNEAMQKSNPDYLAAQGISKELFATLKVNFSKIRREKNIGQQSHDILAFMAYFSPDQINTAEIFLQKKSEKDKQQILDALDRLHKFSVIELEESIARVHRGIQKTIRVEKEQAGTEEETLRKIMTSFCLTSTDHITYVWSHVSKYSKLVNEFIDSIYDEGSTILHLLAKDGNEEVIRLILEKIDPKKSSKVINAVDEEDLTALDYAAMYGHLEIVRYFVEEWGSMNLQDGDYVSPVHLAAESGHLDIIQYLVEKGANVNLQDKGGMSPMNWAANSGYLEIVKYLVEKGANVNLKGEYDINPMHLAAKNGDLEIVKYLIEKEADVNLQDKDGMSSMHWAANSSDLEIVKYLVEKGADVNLQDEYDISPMHLAAKNGDLEIIKYLVEKGANVNLQDKDDMSPMDWAANSDGLEIVKYLVEKGADVNLQDEYDISPMHLAAKNGDLDIIKYLVEKGADVNLQDKDGMSPMHWAANSSDLDIIKYLVEKGADVNLQDKDGMSPMDWAANSDGLEIVKYLVEKGADVNLQDKDGMSPMHWAANSSDLDIIKYLVEKGADVNLQDEYDISPMHLAAKNGDLDIIKYLIEKGADVNLQDKDGMSPMDWAANSSDLEVFKYLVEKEADVNLQDEYDISPMHLAAKNGDLDIIKYLVEKGADVNLKDKDDMSPMHWAAESGHLDIIQYLVEKGANVNLQDKGGMSPMHWATNSGYLEIIEYLVEKGANVNLKGEYDISPMHLAAKSGDLDIIKYLVEKGADVNLQDKDGMSPMDWAANSSDLEVFKYLVEKGANVKLEFKDGLYHNATNYCSSSIYYYGPQSTAYSASDLKSQLHKRQQDTSVHSSESKKRKLEDISVTSNHRIPAFSLNSIAVESVNNKNLKGKILQ